MKQLMLILLVIFCHVACKNETTIVPEEVAYPKEALGERTTVWVKAFEGKNTIQFVNEKNERKVFSVEKVNEKPVLLSVYDRGVSGQQFELETMTYYFQNTSDPSEAIRFQLLGNRYVYVHDELQPPKEVEYLFRIFVQKGTLFQPNVGYNVQIGARGNEVNLNKYHYGVNFPELGSDKLDVNINKSASFLRQLVLSHEKGIDSFRDNKDITWKIAN
ncbi:hypothetical protein [Runella sp. SP2]|uniref:hypothetical protein n=1 Tax=Runella sp. SP2 TaxID=2268026 RepID=UPI000F07A75D|nr:hypothetical protein [Runella sp. SP2]AYQ31163.1 hypothetical protein DTQ70_02770 [Runella sp. SP2]